MKDVCWRSGRKICFKDNIERLKVGKNNGVEDNINHTKNILVFDKKRKILGIANSDERYTIKPKVVFDAIG